MHYIIYDLEATCWEGRPPGVVQETIEIGAYRVDAYGDVLSSFNRLVRPVVHRQMSLFCRQLTGIDQTDINRAEEFPAVIDAFIDWIGYNDDEDYALASWGRFDAKQLRRDCDLHRIDDDWIYKVIDCKAQYASFQRLKRPRGLAACIRKEGLEWHGEQHRALPDAANLVNLFRAHFDMWRPD